ncbi:hypothetical protein DUNSADRAFT_12892 [Dunaliella salina]|uniref:Uncharacterized protein n=1 Tax=Dunaliella salina TaxID=3046 RepID=A0ABQ7H3P2_DUNSA|nr:hypothetical protein DUNSADRAFT_12892 [Dunaliella salina]|eukprot:KAF5841449.1 hypothetical protein DUNSADRAFT_12892 [Dunaliella salina]
MDALPLVDQLMGFLQAQPQEKAALKRLVGICAVTIRKSLIWCNDQISASLSPAAMKQQAAAPSPFSADGLQPTLHRLSSYLSSPTNSPRRWSASVSSLQAELLQQPDVAPAAEMERRPSYSSLLEGAYPSRLLHDAAVTALRDESSQRWQAMQGTSPGREEVQWGRGLQQRGFLTDIPMQIWAVLLGFRGLTNNEGLDERAEDTYTDQFQAAQSVGQSTSTSLIVLQLAVSFFYLRALPGCQVRLVKEQAGTASVSGPVCSSDSVLVADLAAGAAIHLWRANPRRGQCSALCQFHCATGAVPGRPPDSCCGARTEGLVTSASILTAFLSNNAAGRHNKSYHFSSAVHFKLAFCDCGYECAQKEGICACFLPGEGCFLTQEQLNG